MSMRSRLFERARALSHQLRERWAARRTAVQPCPRDKSKGRNTEMMGRLESRTMLTVTAGEYAAIRSTYADFALPADMAQMNIIEITPEQLSVGNLKIAITTAAATTLSDLVVLRTTNTQNRITYASSADVVSIDIPSTKGATSIVSLGSQPLTLDGGGKSRVISVGAHSSSTTIVNMGSLAITNGYDGSSSFAGGIWQENGTLRLRNLTISGNRGYSGGGMYKYAGTAYLTNVTIEGNSAVDGAGIYTSQGSTVLTNVVIAGNTADASGGGAYLTGTSTLYNVTITANTAGTHGGGVYVGGTVPLRNTIIAKNGASAAPDLYTYGGGVSGSNNLIGDGTGQTSLVNGISGNIVGTAASPIDPLLAEGTAQGIGLAPLSGSPAIDRGSNSLIPSGVSTDVYGSARIQGSAVNIGAVETVLSQRPGATYIVTSLADSVAVDGELTLREALAAANSNQDAGDAPAGSYSSVDHIEFAPGLSGTICTNGQEYLVFGSLQLVGPGADRLKLSGGGTSRVVRIVGMYSANISGLTIADGHAVSGAGLWGAGASLVLDHAVIEGNTATSGGGGLYLNFPSPTLNNVSITGNTAETGGGGGMVQARGSLAMSDVRITDNTAERDGGGFLQSSSVEHTSTATLKNVTIAGNTASGNGGGASISGVSTMTNVVISDNRASGDYSYGGGIRLDGTLTLNNVTVTANTATADGGGLYHSYGTTTMNNTIVAANASGGAGPDLYQQGTLRGANNLIGDGTGQTAFVHGVSGNLVGNSTNPIDPMLAEGTSPGIGRSPLPASRAIDAGSNALVPAGTLTDIYGAPRVQGAKVNIGAVETVLPAMQGVTYVVTSLAGGIAADGVLTLREALAAANANQAIGDAPAGSYSSADRIEVLPGLTGTILTGGEAYQIRGSVDLAGPGAGMLTLDAAESSGVLDIRGRYAVRISGVTITRGATEFGGGVYSSGAQLSLDSVTIDRNSAINYGGNYGTGGGLFLYMGKVTLTNVSLTNNWSVDEGAGAYLSYCTTTLLDSRISGNVSEYGEGGGIYQYYGTSTWTNVVITANEAWQGAGVYQSYGSSLLTNTTIAGNQGATDGSGIYVQWGTAALRNTIVARNAPATGGDLYVRNSTLSGASNLIGNGTGQTVLVNGASGNIVGTATTPVDPQFVDISGTDWTQWNLHLQPTSPAANAGDNALVPAGVMTDITGGPRILGSIVDMGAYERDPDAPTITSVSINNGAVQRSMVTQVAVRFSEPVSLSPGALTLRLTSGAAVLATLNLVSSDQQIYTLTFSGAGVVGGSLADGIYDLIVTASGIQDLAGNPLTASYSQRFHRLFGDSDGNKIINALDYARLKQTFGRAPSDPLFNSAFDYEGNNLINALDLARFRQRYGMSYSY